MRHLATSRQITIQLKFNLTKCYLSIYMSIKLGKREKIGSKFRVNLFVAFSVTVSISTDPYRFPIQPCYIWDGMSMFHMPDLKSWPAPTLGLRRFKVSSAVVYALFILVIYSHAILARWQFTLRRSYLKVAGRENAARIYTEVAWDRADRGLCSQRRPWIMGPTREGRRENGRWRADEKKNKNSTKREESGRASLLAFIRDGGLWTVGAEYKKSRRALSVLTADTLRFLNVATAGRPPFRSETSPRPFPPIPDFQLTWRKTTRD